MSDHPAYQVDGRLVGAATTEVAQPAGGVHHRVAGQLAHLPGGLGLVESDGEGEARVTVNIHGLTSRHSHLARTVQDVSLGT